MGEYNHGMETIYAGATGHDKFWRLASNFRILTLHCLSIDHTKITYRLEGRDSRLTDVAGNALKQLLA